MRSYKKNVKDVGEVEFVEFDSLYDFKNYIMSTPNNRAFGSRGTSDSTTSDRVKFTKTKSFDEAMNLFTDGWTPMSRELVNKLNTNNAPMVNERAMVRTIGMQGFQPVIPLYLAGVPQNMIGTKFKPMKKKVITIDKDVCYSCYVSSDEIVEESVKALAIVRKLESQNYRINLNIVFCPVSGFGTSKKRFAFKIKIKGSNERLNVGKMSFPLVHPSMLRRLLFKLEEVYPNVPSSFVGTYGRPMDSIDITKCYDGEFVLPRFIKTDIDKLKDVSELYQKKV